MTATAIANVVGKTVGGLDIVQRPNGGLKIGKALVGPSVASRYQYMLSKGAPLDGGRCFECKAEHAVFDTGHRRVRSELVIITYTCAVCGHKDLEPFD